MLVAICLKVHIGLGTEIYMKPSLNSPCPVKTCLTLSQISTKQVLDSLIDKHNATLLFTSGNYSLESKISITNVSNISMISMSSSDVSIFCKKHSNFKFEGVSKLLVKGFNFIGCGNNEIKLIKEFLLENTTFIGVNESETVLEIHTALVNITACLFMYNTVGSFRGPIRILEGHKCQYARVGGVIIANHSSVTVIRSAFIGNGADIGGAIFATQGSEINLINSSFIGNTAVNFSAETCVGGVLYIEDRIHDTLKDLKSTIVITESEFSDNIATNGGILTAVNSTVNIISSQIYNNMAEIFGGVMYIYAGSILKVSYTEMYNNHALKKGGVVYINASTTYINVCQIRNNLAGISGGVILADGHCSVIINGSLVHNNSAQQWTGGVIATLHFGSSKEVHSEVLTSITICNSIFHKNFANYTGGVLYIDYSSNATIIDSNFINNLATIGGGAFEFRSKLVTIKDVKFLQNRAVEGGAIRMLQSKVIFSGTCNLLNNSGFAGGAIYAVDSMLEVTNATIAAECNQVLARGGALYIYRSRLLCKYNCTVNLFSNTAKDKGGGICAINSIISVTSEGNPDVESSVQFIRNGAGNGGGVYLELNSQLYIFKHDKSHLVNFYFIENSASTTGGAIYVRDDTFTETCLVGISLSATNKFKTYDGTYCFVQVISHGKIRDFSKFTSLTFTDNNSQRSGSILYGGLLDRCTINNAVKYYLTTPNIANSRHIDGVTYFRNISNFSNHTHFQPDLIDSDPVSLCFCSPSSEPDCEDQLSLPPVQIKKGEEFNISLVVVNQVKHILPQRQIHVQLKYEESGLGDGQQLQNTNNKCTNLTFSVYSPRPTEILSIYPTGPCDHAPRSGKSISIIFLKCVCPIGLQPKRMDQNISCECICDLKLYPYIADPNCDPQTGMLLKDGNFWITNLTTSSIESTSGHNYILYPHCPLDYCLPHVHLDLNVPNGADAQCANNRSGLLCSRCKPGLSLSLGSSLCIPCIKVWRRDIIIILMTFFVSGLLLVVSILVLNLTVAIGTLNGLIFYANIIGANTSMFFPTTNLRFLSVFLSWLNLEVGFDICFYNGMDTYWKTWLQLAFPAYIIMLVIIIIVVSEYSMKFSELIAKRNPVATLATLVLLSYTKLLHIMISSISFGIVTFPNGSHEVVWLPDASVKYLHGKHIALFLLGILILLVGIIYTSLLFFWQWLLRHQNRWLLKWIGHQRLCHFIEPYHAPYAFKHRYWTGVLLLARVILYLVFVLNKSGDPGVNMIAISVVSCNLMFLKALIGRIYKNWIVQAINVTCFLNMALLTLSTLYSQSSQSIFAFISGSVVILLFFLVLSYHIFTEIFLEMWKKLIKKKVAESLDYTNDNDLSNVSEIDFGSRDQSPADEFSLDKHLNTDRQELPTLPDCGNSYNSRGNQRHESKAALSRSRFSDDDDTDSEGSMTPLLK